MRKKIIIGIIIFLVIWLVLFVRYGLFLVIYLTTPPLRQNSLEEKVFFDSLQNVCQCRNIKREPKWDYEKKLEHPYSIIFYDVNSESFKNKDSLKMESFKIAKRAYVINHLDTAEFKEYWINIFGKDGGEEIYKYQIKDFK